MRHLTNDPARRTSRVTRTILATATLGVIGLALPLAGTAAAAPAQHHHKHSAHRHTARNASVQSATVTTSANANAAANASATVSGTANGATISASGTASATASASASATATATASTVLAAQTAARVQAYAQAYSKAYTSAYAAAYAKAYAAATVNANAALQSKGGSTTGSTTSSAPTAPAAPVSTAPVSTAPVTSGGGSTTGTSTTGSSTNCGGEVVLKADGTTYTCSFDDEFNGTSLDTSKWSALTTAGAGYRNGPECYVDSPNTINESNGVLNLTAYKLDTPMSCTDSVHGNFSTSYVSGSVDTLGKFSQTYGRYEIRAKFPAATVKGLQSSLWMWPTNTATYGKSSGEIDIAEWYSQYADRAIPYLHYAPTTMSGATGYGATGTNIVTDNYCTLGNANAFHTYAATWTPTSISIQFDGKTCMTDNFASNLGGAKPFDVPFFMVLTQALGQGTNAFDTVNTPLPATTSVDYVRAWS